MSQQNSRDLGFFLSQEAARTPSCEELSRGPGWLLGVGRKPSTQRPRCREALGFVLSRDINMPPHLPLHLTACALLVSARAVTYGKSQWPHYFLTVFPGPGRAAQGYQTVKVDQKHPDFTRTIFFLAFIIHALKVNLKSHCSTKCSILFM